MEGKNKRRKHVDHGIRSQGPRKADYGKVLALWKAGWDIREIARETRMTYEDVHESIRTRTRSAAPPCGHKPGGNRGMG